jgi:ArsR family transcriptional regulator
MITLVDFFKLVSDETRLRIVVLLAQEDLYVCQIAGVLNLSQPKTSKHLSKLRDLNYVKDERIDKYIRYSLQVQDENLQQLIHGIVQRIHQYPVLSEDRKQLIHKDVYLHNCKTKNL